MLRRKDPKLSANIKNEHEAFFMMLEIKNPKILTALKNEHVRSVTRRIECLDSSITCNVKFNGKQVIVPSPWTWIGMAKTIDLEAKVKNIMLHLI